MIPQTTLLKLSPNNELQGRCLLVCDDSRVVLEQYKNQVDLIVTSPPYADARHRHYDSVHPDKYKEWFLSFHDAFYNALKPTGSLVINIKDRVVGGTRHRYVWHTIEALCDRGWYAIDDYIWHKPNPMPGYWPTRLSDGWEYCFHLAKDVKPFFDHDGVKKPIGDWAKTRLSNLSDNDLNRHNSVNKSGFGRNVSRWVGKKKVAPSNVITSAVVGKNKKHPAVYPLDIPEFFIKLLTPENGLVVDPFGGSGTTAVAALNNGRNCILIDNQRKYYDIAVGRIIEETDARQLPPEKANGYMKDVYQIQTPLQPRLLEKVIAELSSET